MKLSRRNFLKTGSAAAALGLLSANLAGCSAPSAAESTAASSQASAGAATETATQETQNKLYTAYINPQRTDYKTNTKELKTLFSPLTIGSVTIGNRIVKSAAGSATYLAGLTDELMQYYVNFAKGGVELIYVENLSMLNIKKGESLSEETKTFFRKMVEECASYGASLGYQWYSMGGQENTMTVAEIQALEDDLAETAKALKDLGFKAFEINSAGFNIGAHFMSRFYNTRTDEYGCNSFEDRTRFLTESVQKIKDVCGSDFNVQILMNAIEANDNTANNPTMATLDSAVTTPKTKANTLEESIEMAKYLEQAGVDSLHLRLGSLGHHVAQFASDLYFILNGIEGVTGFGNQFDFKKHWQGQLIGDTQGAGMLLNVSARYKEAVSIPCGVVTYMDPAHAPDLFEQALEDGKADFFLMTRPLTVDTEYVNKLKEGRIDEIAPCTRCLHCHIGSNEANAAMGYCRVNALTQRVMREGGPATYELEKAPAAKNVMVIGGGPAGMEAARIAAARGHNVTLYEKNKSLGGLLDFANAVKGPHENLLEFKKYLIRQLELTGVKVETEVEVDQAKIKEVNPDAVILAVGGLRDTLTIDGDGQTPVIELDDFMSADMGENVIVYGSNAQAFDTALWLVVHKKNVTMVTPNKAEELDMQQSQHAMRMMTTALYALGMNVYPQSQIVTVENGKATILMETGVTTEVACDAIVNGADMLKNTALVDGLSGIEVYTIGDCAAPFNIAKAIHSGNDAGRQV